MLFIDTLQDKPELLTTTSRTESSDDSAWNQRDDDGEVDSGRDRNNGRNVHLVVISFHEARLDELEQRNKEMGDIHKTTWFRAIDDYDKILTHWHLLRLTLNDWNMNVGDIRRRPAALLVLEDDATCIHGLIKKTTNILSLLPSDWDLLFLGGTPIANHYDDSKNNNHATQSPPLPTTTSTTRRQKAGSIRRIAKLSIKQSLQPLASQQGVFGNSTFGPLAPDGSSQRLLLNQPYWILRYIANTYAYVINPKRAERILNALERVGDYYYQEHVDVAFAKNIRNGYLTAFIPTVEFCVQGTWPFYMSQDEPKLWKGIHLYPSGNNLSIL